MAIEPWEVAEAILAMPGVGVRSSPRDCAKASVEKPNRLLSVTVGVIGDQCWTIGSRMVQILTPSDEHQRKSSCLFASSGEPG